MKAKGRRRERWKAEASHPASHMQKDLGIWLCQHCSRRDKPTLSLTQSHPEFEAMVIYQPPARQHGGTATPKELGQATELPWFGLKCHIFRGQPRHDTRKSEGARGFCSSSCHGARLLGSSFCKAFFSPAKIKPKPLLQLTTQEPRLFAQMTSAAREALSCRNHCNEKSFSDEFTRTKPLLEFYFK